MDKIKSLFDKAKNKAEPAVSLLKADPCRSAMFIGTMLLLPVMVMLMCNLLPWREQMEIVMLLCAAICAGVLLWQKRLIRGTEHKLLLGFALWLAVTRLLVGNAGTFVDSAGRVGVAAFMAVVVFTVPFMFRSAEGKRKIRAVISDLMIAFSLLVVVVSLAVVIFGFDIRLTSDFTLSEGIYLSSNRLFFMHVHPNSVGQMLLIGAASAVVRIIEERRKPLRIAYAVALPVIMTGIAICDSRACTFAVGAVMAAAAVLVFFVKSKGRFSDDTKGTVIRVGAGAAVCAAAFAAVLLFTDASVSVLESVATGVRESSSQSVMTDGQSAVLIPSGDVNIGRDIEDTTQNIMSLSNRTYIYKYALETLKENPGILLFGRIRDGAPLIHDDGTGKMIETPHFHNSFIEVVFETGLVGLALVVGFVVLMLIKMVKIFFAPFDRYNIAQKFGVIIPGVLLLLSLVEPTLFSMPENYDYRVIYMIFILWCGIVASEYKNKTA